MNNEALAQMKELFYETENRIKASSKTETYNIIHRNFGFEEIG
jgi:hypothetical protein